VAALCSAQAPPRSQVSVFAPCRLEAGGVSGRARTPPSCHPTQDQRRNNTPAAATKHARHRHHRHRQYEPAWQYLQVGNAIMAGLVRYDAASDARNLANIKVCHQEC
jgi:hypothetical protein